MKCQLEGLAGKHTGASLRSCTWQLVSQWYGLHFSLAVTKVMSSSRVPSTLYKLRAWLKVLCTYMTYRWKAHWTERVRSFLSGHQEICFSKGTGNGSRLTEASTACSASGCAHHSSESVNSGTASVSSSE